MNRAQQKFQQNEQKNRSLADSFIFQKGMEKQRDKESLVLMGERNICPHVNLDYVALGTAYLTLLFAWLGCRVRTLPSRTSEGTHASLRRMPEEEAASGGLSIDEEEPERLMSGVLKETGENGDEYPE